MWYINDVGSWWTGLWILLLWGGFIALVVWAVTRSIRFDNSTTMQTQFNIAQERYTKRDVTQEQSKI